MTELQQNRYDQTIRRVGGIIGPGSKVAEVLTELFPVVDVERIPAELLILGQTDLGSGAQSVTAAVGELPFIQLFNPTGTGKLVTVTQLWISTIGVTTIVIASNNTEEGAAINTEVFRDRRRSILNRPAAVMRSGSKVAGINGNFRFIIGANSPVFIKDPNELGILAPGSGLAVGGSSAAGRIDVTFLWRERAAEQSELDLS